MPSVLAAMALLLASVPTARAAPSEPPAPTPAPDGEQDPNIAKAQELYNAGLAEYETFEYKGAIDKWTQAYGMLSGSPGTAQMRNAIVYNIARAREKAYEQSNDVSHLKKAKSLFERYIEDQRAAGNPDEADLANAEARVKELDQRIAEIERKQAAANRPAPSTSQHDEPDKGPKPGRGLIIGGSVSLALGVGLLVGGVTAGGVIGKRANRDVPKLDQLGDEAARSDRIADGRRANIVMLACGVTGGAVALAGVVLVAVGAAKRRNAGRSGRTADLGRMLAPAFGPGFAGIRVAGRF